MRTLNAYKAKSKKLDERLQETRDHLTQLQTTAKNLRQGLEATQRRHAEGDVSIKDVLDRKKKLDETLSEIRTVESIIEQAEELNRQELESMLPAIERELRKNMVGANESLAPILQELKTLRCQSLATMVRLHDAVEELNQNHEEADNIFTQHKAKLRVHKVSMSHLPFYRQNGKLVGKDDESLCAGEQEMRHALGTGQFSPFVKYYLKTGKLVSDKIAIQSLKEKDDSGE